MAYIEYLTISFYLTLSSLAIICPFQACTFFRNFSFSYNYASPYRTPNLYINLSI